MWGEFVEAPWDTTYNASGNYWDKDEVTIQISVDKSQVTLTNYSTYTPVIYGYSPDAPDETVDYIMRIDNTSNIVENILFDGYYDDVGGGDVYTHDVVFMTPEADYTEISNCDFTNFGWEWNPNAPDEYYFYGIVTGGWADSTNYLENVEISNNDFYSNLFETNGAHELYLTKSSYSTFSGNDITNNGEGHPLKIREGCHDITIYNNTIYGASNCFFADYPNDSNETDSYNIKVNSNTFNDPYGVIGSSYEGPFYNPRKYPFISEFWGNTISYLFADSDTVKTYGVACDADSTYLAVYRLDEDSGKTSLYKFRKQGGPLKHFIGTRTGCKHYAQGDMCTTSSRIIVSTFSSNATDSCYVYKFHKEWSGGQTSADTVYTGTRLKVTALAPKNSSTFVTALVESGDAKIYDSTESNLVSSLIWSSAAYDSVTAVAFVNNQYVFAAFKDLATDSTYIFSKSGVDVPVIRAAGEYYITAMTAFGDTLISAKKTTTTSQVYRGTYSNPLETKIDDLSSTDHVISLAGSTNYFYLIKDRKKLHYSNTDSDADKDVLYYSRWWKNK